MEHDKFEPLASREFDFSLDLLVLEGD